MAEHGDKVLEADKSVITAAIDGLKSALAGEDAEAITAKTNELTQAAMKLGEAMYKAQQASAEGAAGGAQPQSAQDDVIDAEFKDVGDDKKKSS